MRLKLALFQNAAKTLQAGNKHAAATGVLGGLSPEEVERLQILRRAFHWEKEIYE